MGRIKLKHFYLNAPLAAGTTCAPPEDLRSRLTRVLRLKAGAEVALFNGRDGLWRATVSDDKAKQLEVLELLHPQPTVGAGLVLALGLPKRDAWESAVRQATELGVTAIQPLVTAYAQRDKLNVARAQALILEAAEQCERLTLPELRPLQPMESWLAALDTPCAWAEARGQGQAALPGAQVVLVGPEGGFSPAEERALAAHPQVTPFSLGPTILRADTAVVAALARHL